MGDVEADSQRLSVSDIVLHLSSDAVHELPLV